MPFSIRNCTLISGLMLLLLASIAFFINFLFYHFEGNNYLPAGVYPAGIDLFMIFCALRYYFDKTHYLCKLIQTIMSIYLTMAAIGLLTNAMQLTPFVPIDKIIIAFEQSLHIDLSQVIAWTAQHSWLKIKLAKIYDSLPYQMSFLPLLIAIFGQFGKVREYLCLMLISAIIGFEFYYFFPTTAPASNILSPFFSPEQYATGIKFKEIHNHLSPSTIEGGMIALPSFHVIWAWLCVYLVRGCKWLFVFLFPINLLLVFSCVLLGWHYPSDVLGALLVILATHGIYQLLYKINYKAH
jgi:hypothetical protein